MESWPLRNRVAFWTGFLTIELIIFGLTSGWMIYREQRRTFLEVNTQVTSPSVISAEATELVLQLARAYFVRILVFPESEKDRLTDLYAGISMGTMFGSLPGRNLIVDPSCHPVRIRSPTLEIW